MRPHQTLIAGVISVAAWVCPVAMEAQRASGTGQHATELFNLPAGLAVFELEHSGDGAFVVRLLDDQGMLVDTLVRAAGPFHGSKAVQVPRTGTYLYDVVAAGSWAISLRPPQSGASAGAIGAASRPSVAAAAVSPPEATADSVRLQATVDADQTARRKGAFPWLLGGLAGGTLLGPVGAGLVYVASNKAEAPPASDIAARHATHGSAYADAFAAAYQAKRRSDRRVAALIGGATGTVVFGFVIAQIVNWSKESGGRSGTGNGQLP